MDQFTLYYPAKPFTITQPWGVYNAAYIQFGFDRHNGVDFLLESDHLLHCPCPMRVTDAGFNSTAGNYVRWITLQTFNVLGTQCYIGGIFMHMESQAVRTGETCGIGDLLGTADNTGFSTGPHTHLSIYRLKANIPNENLLPNRLDLDAHTNNTIDPALFFNGKFAVDYSPPDPTTIVQEGINVAEQASKYPALINGALNLLKNLGQFLSNLKK